MWPLITEEEHQAFADKDAKQAMLNDRAWQRKMSNMRTAIGLAMSESGDRKESQEDRQ